MHLEFQKLLIIGNGKIVNMVLKYVSEKRREYGYQLEYIQHERHSFGTAEEICKKNGIEIIEIREKETLAEFLCDIYDNTLIISANNNYIFPKIVIDKENIVIVNFHNALLPQYAGRNASSWVIYMREMETGITWHYVTEHVDAGDIIIQKSCPIDSNIKAYELAQTLMDLAYECFTEIFQGILTKNIETYIQSDEISRTIYSSKQIPGGGQFTLQDAPESIYRLLRSMDYGKTGIFPNARSMLGGRTIEILRYRKIDKAYVSERDYTLFLPIDDQYTLELKYRWV